MLVFNGYLSENTGFGTASRSYVCALRAAGIELSLLDRNPARRRAFDQSAAPAAQISGIICHAGVSEYERMGRVASRLIALTTSERSVLSVSERRSLNVPRAVWVPCTFNSRVFSACLDKPVYVLPHPVRRRALKGGESGLLRRIRSILSGAFVFISIASWQVRKNLEMLIETFVDTFIKDSSVVLLLKVSFPFMGRRRVKSCISAIVAAGEARHGTTLKCRIVVVAADLPEQDIETLYSMTDCYVAPFKAEGWCYPLFDAACRGIPVIATGYSGPLDYLSRLPHSLLPYEEEASLDTELLSIFDGDGVWANPCREALADRMLNVRSQFAHWRRLAEEEALLLNARYSEVAVGRLARAYLAELSLF